MVVARRDPSEVMELTARLPADRRAHVESRLRSNLIAWLTSVRPDGQPVSVPVWFLLREDETVLIYSQPNKPKLDNIRENPRVALGLDVTDLGRDIIRLEGTAQQIDHIPPANQNEQYVVKYAERIGAMFATPDNFAAMFSACLLITPTRVWA
jgi:PPOX class probable F420-dependent enzyme